MVIAEIGKGADHRASGCGDKCVKIRSLVLSKSGVCSDECGLEIGKGARGRLELWESFPKVCEVRINKEGGIELHFLLIMSEGRSDEEMLELGKISTNL